MRKMNEYKWSTDSGNKCLLFISLSVQTQDRLKPQGLQGAYFCNAILLVHSRAKPLLLEVIPVVRLMPLHRLPSFTK